MGGPESRREGQRKSQAWLRKSCLDALAYDLDVWPRYDVNFYTSVIVGERYKPSTFRALTYYPLADLDRTTYLSKSKFHRHQGIGPLLVSHTEGLTQLRGTGCLTNRRPSPTNAAPVCEPVGAH
jgi:hypothetical protein